MQTTSSKHFPKETLFFFLPAVFSCTQAFRAHHLETAFHPCAGWPLIKSALGEPKTGTTWLLWAALHSALLWAFSDFMPRGYPPVIVQCSRGSPASQAAARGFCSRWHPHPGDPKTPCFPPNPASPGGPQAGLQVPQGGTRPQNEGQQLDNPVATSGQSLAKTCPIFPIFSLAEGFFSVEPTGQHSGKAQGRARLENDAWQKSWGSLL